jgi:ATP-dependent RNA helicase RhlE
MSFHELNLSKPLLNALNDLGFEQPTPIQSEAFSVIMSGRDVLGIAQTGTGKTMAYLLPLLRLWKFSKEIHPQIVILVPTRELVMQVVDEAARLTTYMNVRIQGVYGGANIRTQESNLRMGVDILVATPGRIMDLALNGAVSLKQVKKLVIDEVDEMLNLGFRHQLVTILDLLPEKRQNLLFSATMSLEIEDLIQEFFNDPAKIESDPSGVPVAKIRQLAYEVPNYNTKVNLLRRLIEAGRMEKAVIFVKSRKFADKLEEDLKSLCGELLDVIHSNKSQNNRFRTTELFEEGAIRYLVATDLFARGLDITGISHVINFDMPEEAEFYLHRIGRTGRAEQSGEAISFVTPFDAERKEEAERYMSKRIPVIDLPDDVEISEELIEEEVEVIRMPNVKVKLATKLGPDAHAEGKMSHKKIANRKTPPKKKRRR